MKKLFFTLIALLIFVYGASAHSKRVSAINTEGLEFESASHGELIILTSYSSAIVSLARSSVQTDESFRRLMNYAAIEYSYCLWGFGPRAAEDETSPFNECTHAYLSAQKALLLHMRQIADVRERAAELVSRIDADAVRSGAAFIGCAFTGERFTTAEFVTPHWELLTGHPPSLVLFIFGGFFVAFFLFFVMRMFRTKTTMCVSWGDPAQRDPQRPNID